MGRVLAILGLHCGLLGAGCGAGERDPLGITTIQRDLLAQPGTWRVVRSRADSPPRIEVICPAASEFADGADMPALVLDPPAEVHFEIDASSLPARLVARVGVDLAHKKRVVEPLRIAFEFRSGERSLARTEIELGRDGPSAWVDLGGTAGIELTTPTTLILRTEALGGDGKALALPFPLGAGFADLRLELRLERARAKSTPAAPSVVLVVMDTLRLDRLSCYGYARRTSPRLDELAARGVLFERCSSSASWTWPATASILTGLTPMEHGVVSAASSFLLDEAATLAEALQAAGFTTAGWSGNPIVSAARNFDQGFESYWSPPGRFETTGVFFEEVRAFLQRRAGSRFFLYLHLADPHKPLRPLEEGLRGLAADVPTEFVARSDDFYKSTSQGQGILTGGALALDGIVSAEDRARMGQLYDACVWSGDHWLGLLLDELAALGIEDETIVAFTSDHGEELFERGIIGHGQSLHGELVKAPLVLAGPGLPRGERLGTMVSTRVVAPMLAGLAGVPFDGSQAALRVLRQGEPDEDWLLFTTSQGVWKKQRGKRIYGMSDGTWKLTWAPNAKPWGATDATPDGDIQLYNTALDPGELEDLAASHPEEAARLRALLEERIHALETRRIGVGVPAGAATQQRLQDLGYTGD